MPSRLRVCQVANLAITHFRHLRSVRLLVRGWDAHPVVLLRTRSFSGRDREVAAVVHSLRAGNCLITLTSTGGAGKTRPALRVAACPGLA